MHRFLPPDFDHFTHSLNYRKITLRLQLTLLELGDLPTKGLGVLE